MTPRQAKFTLEYLALMLQTGRDAKAAEAWQELHKYLAGEIVKQLQEKRLDLVRQRVNTAGHTKRALIQENIDKLDREIEELMETADVA